MKIINEIINHPKYMDYYNQILTLEKDRVFCKHDMTHFLDVARIAYIKILEDQADISKEDIYIVSILHDIGRFEQYLNGEAHEKASTRLCVDILRDLNISESKIVDYQTAISNHRNKLIKDNKDLSGYLYRGDKASRPCHSCPQESNCSWDMAKKNMNINI